MAAAPIAASEPARLQIEIQGTDSLPRAAHLNLPVLVTLPSDDATPLLLTPSVEGSALEIVRGRLMRSDAKPVGANQLRFELPLLARSEGTAILRVEVSTYVCEPRAVLGAEPALRGGSRCRPTAANASRVFHVR